ncbi:uncharacterized protein LOC108698646 [Xenopus laevis]|uniref:Uncharacterized protein LOC108698646 n=2 Tax=Xenopus laevis TaxID=8355 RepID=A0A1L8F931_XENLA|nr:uncharacterized protein LOC108698646 [Xenopus laevis]XP_018085782.1 uncharacterized protein LOC108698646 [Xenopus laevis]XP_041428893.1 uncharacterized protein LOC108698646 [Xenopus laevis]XP_041428894.1 uncharacterized protein LOC108698646 [Xenopus laevis]OCT68086.1 hypothetical protein XELAEV_18039382mg [Xenopus laevis]
MREEDNTFKKDDSVSSVLCPSYSCSSPHICSSSIVAPLPFQPSSSFEPPSVYPSLPSVPNSICPEDSPLSDNLFCPYSSSNFPSSNGHSFPSPYCQSEHPVPTCDLNMPSDISIDYLPLYHNSPNHMQHSITSPHTSTNNGPAGISSFCLSPGEQCPMCYAVPSNPDNISSTTFDQVPSTYTNPHSESCLSTSSEISQCISHSCFYKHPYEDSCNNVAPVDPLTSIPTCISSDFCLSDGQSRNTSPSPDNCSSCSLAPSTSFIPNKDLIHLHTFSSHVEFSSSLSSNTLTCCSHAPLPMAPHLSSVHLARQMDSNGCKMCYASVENRTRMDEYKHQCEQFLDDLSRFEDWLKGIQMTLSLPDVSQALHREAKLALRRHEVVLKELREKLLDLESLNIKYWKLAQVPHQIFLPNNLCSRMQEVNQFLDKVQKEAEEVIQALKIRVQQREEFDADREEMRLWLTEMDLGLSSVEYMYNGNSTEKIHRLQEFQEDVRSTMKRMDKLLERGDQLIEESDQLDAEFLENELKELGSYCQDIFIRFSRFQKRLVSTKLVFEDNLLVDDLETMSLGSSEVFCELEREDVETQNPSLKLSGPCLLACKQEAPVGAPNVDLEWDPLGDVGTSESIDGGESFHTANSVPWRVLHRESGSSLNSVLWSLGPEANHAGDTEHFGDVMNTINPSWDSQSLKRDVKETDSRREFTDPSAKPNLSSVPFNSLQETFENGDDANTSCTDLADSRKSTHRLEAEKEIKITQNSSKSLAADLKVFNCTQVNSCISQRRRQSQMERTQNLMLHAKCDREEVSILMESSDEIYYGCKGKSSHCKAAFLPVWIKRLVYLFLLILFIGTCLLVFPVDQPRCYSHSFAWSLMLSYVNGPPPT